jgi:hypothetical protein
MSSGVFRARTRARRETYSKCSSPNQVGSDKRVVCDLENIIWLLSSS